MKGQISRREFGMGLVASGLMAATVSSREPAALTAPSAPQNASAIPSTGGFRITYVPYRRPGHEDFPVRVFNVNGQAMKEPLIRRFSLLNLSAKAIKKIEISMHVSEDKHAFMNVLHEVHSSYVSPTPLAPQGEHLIKGVDKLKDLFSPLLVGGQLTGNYKVEVLVSEVEFEDGSTWKL